MRKLIVMSGLAALLLVPLVANAAAPAKPTTTTAAPTTTTAPQPPALRGYYVSEQQADIPEGYASEWFDVVVTCASGGNPLSGGINGLTGWAITKSFPAFPPPGGGATQWFFRLTRIPNASGAFGTVTAYATCAYTT